MNTVGAGVAGASRARRRAAVALLVALLAALLAAVLPAAPASAHAVLVGSDPADGSRLETAPAQVTLRFDESVRLAPGSARALSTDGRRVDTGEAREADGVVVVPLEAGLGPGSYFVTWRLVSADSHMVTGSVAFGVGQDAVPAAADAPARTPLDAAADAASGVGYVGVALGVGVPLVALALWPSVLRVRRTRVLAGIGAVLVLVGALVELLTEGPRAAGSGWRGLVRLDDLGQAFASAHGLALAARVALAVALGELLLASRPLGAATRARRRWAHPWALALAAVGLGVVATTALVGHASTGSGAGLAVTVTAVHVAGMAAWAGGLTVLLAVVLPRLAGAPRIDVGALGRWSAVAFGAVVALVASGAYQAVREVRPLAAVWSTRYGVTLLVKLALVVLVLAAATVARRAVVGRDARRDPSGRARLAVVRRSVRAEAVLVVLVLAVTTALVAQAPAAATYGPPVTMTTELAAGRTARITVDHSRRGTQAFTLAVLDATGRPVPIHDVSGQLSSGDNEVAAIDVAFRHGRGEVWDAPAASVPLAGSWKLTVDLAIGIDEAYATAATYRVW